MHANHANWERGPFYDVDRQPHTFYFQAITNGVGLAIFRS